MTAAVIRTRGRTIGASDNPAVLGGMRAKCSHFYTEAVALKREPNCRRCGKPHAPEGTPEEGGSAPPPGFKAAKDETYCIGKMGTGFHRSNTSWLYTSITVSYTRASAVSLRGALIWTPTALRNFTNSRNA